MLCKRNKKINKNVIWFTQEKCLDRTGRTMESGVRRVRADRLAHGIVHGHHSTVRGVQRLHKQVSKNQRDRFTALFPLTRVGAAVSTIRFYKILQYSSSVSQSGRHCSLGGARTIRGGRLHLIRTISLLFVY